MFEVTFIDRDMSVVESFMCALSIVFMIVQTSALMMGSYKGSRSHDQRAVMWNLKLFGDEQENAVNDHNYVDPMYGYAPAAGG